MQSKSTKNTLEQQRKAAELNDAEAQLDMGFYYANGEGVTKNVMEAVRWFRKAAGQNHAEAQFNLGLFYANGEGVAKDYVAAHKWCLLAAGQGGERAKEAVTALECKMTREQIAEGQKLAREFKPQKMKSGN